MATCDYTDIVARFSDQFAAEALASFIASLGIPCDLAAIWSPGRLEPYGILVQRDRIAELRRVLRLQPVAKAVNPVAAQLIAGRLAREGIPCYVGGRHNPSLWGGDADVPIRETQELGDMIAVPEAFFGRGLRVLNKSLPSDAELSELALLSVPDDS